MDNQDSPLKDLSQKQKQELHKIYTNLSDIDADRDKQVIIMENALRLTGTAASPEAAKESGEALTKARLAIAKADTNEASIMSRLSPRPDLLKPLSALRELDSKANAGDISAGRLLFKSRDELREAVAAKGTTKRGDEDETENAISPVSIQEHAVGRSANAHNRLAVHAIDNQDSPVKGLSQQQKAAIHEIYHNQRAYAAYRNEFSDEVDFKDEEDFNVYHLNLIMIRDQEHSIKLQLDSMPDLIKPLATLHDLAAKADAGNSRASSILHDACFKLSEAAGAQHITEGVSPNQEEPAILKKRKKLDPILHDAAASILLPRLVLDRYSVRGKDIVDKADPKRIIFTDKGDKLTAKRDATAESVQAMLDTAESRGWTSLKVTGSKEFRRQAYLEAGARGLAIQGYEPSKEEKEFVELQAEKNKKLNTVQLNPAADRFLKAQTVEERRAAASQHPELMKAFALEASFKRFAENTLAPQHREAFVERQRSNIADDLNSGKELPDIQFRQNVSQQRDQNQDVSR